MTAAQKTAKEKFKKAIAYRKKTGCTLKQAFAHVYGKKSVGAVKKKAAPKKKASLKKKAVLKKKVLPKKKAVSYHKDTKSHNVNIRVISGTKSLIDIQRDIDDIKWLTKRIKEYQDTINYVKNIKPKERTIFQKSALAKSQYGIKNLKQALTKVKRNIR